MDILLLTRYFCTFVMVIAVIGILQPVLAQEGSMTISYRGAGGYYIGDTIIFDGKNTIGNTTLLKISGPGLTSQGVPVYDLNGIPGSGNTAPVSQDCSWKFVWSSANIIGVEKLVTARYTITAFDLTNPEKTASVSILMKKPEFYINLQQSQINPGDYVQLNGNAERGVKEVQIAIADSNGTILRSYTSSVSGSGYFNYGFHADMQPGQYIVSVSNPSMKSVLKTSITVVPPGESAPTTTVTSQISTPSESLSVPPTPSPNLTQPVSSSPSAIPLSPLIAIAGLIISGIIILVLSTGRRV